MNFADLASLARDFVAQPFDLRNRPLRLAFASPHGQSSIAFARYTVELLD